MVRMPEQEEDFEKIGFRPYAGITRIRFKGCFSGPHIETG